METPRSPESSARLSAAETNPLPQSSARAWTFPRVIPVIREKEPTPVVAAQRRIRVDGTEEIMVEDIVVIVPPKHQPEELADEDLVVEAEPEPFRTPTVSVHATQEVLVDDVLAVEELPAQREERPSYMPWTVNAPVPVEDDLAFPPSLEMPTSGLTGAFRRITNYSATQVFRRRSANVKVVAAAVGVAASLMIFAGVARMGSASTDGPVGIAVHSPKKLDKTIRARSLEYGKAARLDTGLTVDIDALPTARPAARLSHWRHR